MVSRARLMELVRVVNRLSTVLLAVDNCFCALTSILPNLSNSSLTLPKTLLISSAFFWILSVLKPTDKEFKSADRVDDQQRQYFHLSLDCQKRLIVEPLQHKDLPLVERAHRNLWFQAA